VAAIRSFSAKLEAIIQETKDTVSLAFQTPEPLEYRPGQFLSIAPKQFPALRQQIAHLEYLKRTSELVRSYSLSSTPDDPHLIITIKEEVFVPGVTLYPPLLSPYLVHGLSVGMEFEMRGFSGIYVLPDDLEEREGRIVHLVAGSGIVPNFSILRWALVHRPKLKHLMLYSNKTSDNIIFGAQLTALEEKYPDKLQIIHCLTGQGEEPHENLKRVHLGRINQELLAEALSTPSMVYLCGPALTRFERKAAKAKGEEPKPRFVDTMRALLFALNLPIDRLKMESYG
jgi:3-ketosteroid 9alpha-monooxygenase subunit B